ncbi:leucine--tRNA ligase [Nitrososphaera viennensis]|uniref:Leucine--tRNA ligase n=2 Tax=Nitrososphaera viennensis TaxID=1034015 RepID=A0A060HQ85_9ARCH|nr:leucine--tRNA ligase [Nitrososphaera viennensis]AIC17280.1 leucine--tRNA ligase [Nitrososphaera viennensis EN76]UVS69163.1 leucine--tRNA ligase [Nitrososphaera viennensis]
MSSITDWRAIEEKWIKRWDEQKLFQADPDPSRKKYFVTVAYPYPNSPQHIGHGRTYTLADAHARYMRMKGYNVLFPMGFHYTGTPILGMSRRVAAGDKDLLDTFHNIYKLADDVIATFVEPVKIASYFHNEIKQGMKEMGYSMDWRREFTTIDRIYSKFISWQFRTLQKKGLIVQGSHPVGWCPNDQNPVSQHDTMGDVEPDFTEYVLVKFAHDGLVVPAATLRPETLFGVTNMWVNPDVEYVEAKVDGERWVVSREAARKLEFLNHAVEIAKTIKGSEMVGWQLTNPLNNARVPMYPASFVEADSGTGIVMSVPAHAPYDYQALADLKNDTATQQKYGIAAVVEPVKIIESEGYSGIPAAEAIANVPANSSGDRLEKATSDLYSHEFYKGRMMMQNTGKYAGKPVSVAKEELKAEIASSGLASVMYELTNKPVRCRCGAECVVKLLNDQWFLNYGDKEWKALAHECIQKMDIVPQDIRQEFDYVVDWLRERACARKSGLGTKLPWDPEWIIESLSDSVIYMAYYTIAKYVNDKTIPDTETISDSFFDYVLFGQGDAEAVARESGVPAIEKIRAEFKYFYPVDSRHSGRDLVPNHLSFFIFNHVAIFDRDNWPRQIVVNGSVLMEGKKMSKSLGNIIPLRAAIREHGADTIRLAMLVSAEILQDADFSFDTARGIKSKLAGVLEMAERVKDAAAAHAQAEQVEDRWLASRLVRTAAQTAESMDRLRVREAIHHILYALEQDLQWYDRRVRAKGRENSPAVMSALKEYVRAQVQMLAPFAPFTAEEVWERLGSKEMVTEAGWPSADQSKLDIMAEESEFLVQGLIADIANIVKVTKIAPRKIVVYASAGWKSHAYKTVLENIAAGRTNFGDMMKQLIASPETSRVKSDPNLVKKMQDDILSTPLEARSRRATLAGFDEVSAIKDAAGLLGKEFNGAEVLVYSEDDASKYDPKAKARFARPFKPAVYME